MEKSMVWAKTCYGNSMKIKIPKKQNEIVTNGGRIFKIAKCRGVKHLHTIAAKKE